MKKVNFLKSLAITFLIALPFSIMAQSKVASTADQAKASLANKKFNLIIHSSDGSEGIKDFIVFGQDGFETKAGKSAAAANSRYMAKQDDKGAIHFTATIVTPEGMKTYSGTVQDNKITGKYIFEATGQPAVSYALNGTLDNTR